MGGKVPTVRVETYLKLVGGLVSLLCSTTEAQLPGSLDDYTLVGNSSESLGGCARPGSQTGWLGGNPSGFRLRLAEAEFSDRFPTATSLGGTQVTVDNLTQCLQIAEFLQAGGIQFSGTTTCMPLPPMWASQTSAIRRTEPDDSSPWLDDGTSNPRSRCGDPGIIVLSRTFAHSDSPSLPPTITPTVSLPTVSPSTSLPSDQPTRSPSASPSNNPTSNVPTLVPTATPTNHPTTLEPTRSPIPSIPTFSPTKRPTGIQTLSPTYRPTVPPTENPTVSPTTSVPTTSPTSPTASPSSSAPTRSLSPTISPSTSAPTMSPTTSPLSSSPTNPPTTSSPSLSPTNCAEYIATLNLSSDTTPSQLTFSDSDCTSCSGQLAIGFSIGMGVTLLITGIVYLYLHKIHLEHDREVVLSSAEAFSNPAFAMLRAGSISSRRQSLYSTTSGTHDPFATFEGGTGGIGNKPGPIYDSATIPEQHSSDVMASEAPSARRLSNTMAEARFRANSNAGGTDPVPPPSRNSSGTNRELSMVDGGLQGQSDI